MKCIGTRDSCVAIIALVVCLALLGAAPSRAELKAGAARVDITPDVKASKIPLGGYAARKGAASTGVHTGACWARYSVRR